MSSSLCCGPSAPPPPSQQARPRSSSSMEQKRFSLTRSSIAPRGVLASEEAQQDAMRGMVLVLGEKRRREATLRAARYQQALRRYHCRSVRSRMFEVGDLVLRRVLSREGLHKLSPMREGPFRVAHVSRPGAVRLETQDGVPIQNAWNIQHLRMFYP